MVTFGKLEQQKGTGGAGASSFWRRCFAVKKDTQASLRRFAWRYFLQKYRDGGSQQASALEYAVQSAIMSGGIVYMVARILTLQPKTTAFNLTLALIALALWGLWHLVRQLKRYLSLAADFAEDAILNAETQREVEEYFDDTFPWLFYRK